jgi:hypothetical protein|tara:strand:+ start:329 stop:616 length:288 start_codon:yes stop_codon:yes gene_type:complete
MKLEDLKGLIREELRQRGSAEEGEKEIPATAAAAEEVRDELMYTVRNLTGVQPDEVDIIEFLNNLIDLAKRKNINNSSLRRALALVKKQAASIAK